MPIALLTAILPALIPVFSDGLRGLFGRLTKGAGIQPQNIDEAVKLMQAEVEYTKAMAELDKPAANISTWVADLRGSFRYLAAGLTIILGYGVVFLSAAKVLEVPEAVQNEALYMGNAAFSFAFGDRSYAYLRQGK